MKRHARIIGLVVGLLVIMYVIMLPQSCYVLSAVVQGLLASQRTYTFQREGDMSAGPSADDALRYARLALAKRVDNPEDYELLGEPGKGNVRWLVQFIHRSDGESNEWRKAWSVYVEFKENEVEVQISLQL